MTKRLILTVPHATGNRLVIEMTYQGMQNDLYKFRLSKKHPGMNTSEGQLERQ